MSRKLGLDIVNCNNCSGRIGRMEFINHPRFMQELTGINPFSDLPRCEAEMYRRLDMDIILGINFATPAKLFDDDEQVTTTNDKGETVSRWGATGTTFKVPIPLSSPEEVLKFKPLERKDWLVDIPKNQITNYVESTKLVGETSLVTLNFWTTLLHWGTMFPWEYFMMAAYIDPHAFGWLLDDFEAVSAHIINELSQTNAPVIMCHDDLAMGDRTLFSPEWTRKNVICRYERIFAPAKKLGKKILFISDGDITELVPDLVKAGVDGIVFEPMVDLAWMAQNYGDKIMLAGNADSRLLTGGMPDDCRAEVRRCAETAGTLPGYAFMATGGIVHNVPMKNVQAYLAEQDRYRYEGSSHLLSQKACETEE